MSSETVSREDRTLITPIGGQVEFVPPFGKYKKKKHLLEKK